MSSWRLYVPIPQKPMNQAHRLSFSLNELALEQQLAP